MNFIGISSTHYLYIKLYMYSKRNICSPILLLWFHGSFADWLRNQIQTICKVTWLWKIDTSISSFILNYTTLINKLNVLYIELY